jgi:1-deoxyxylulose-5-phosphate synthase
VVIATKSGERRFDPAAELSRRYIIHQGPLHGGLLAGMQVEEREFSGDRRFGGSGFTDTELEIGCAVERLSQEWGLEPYQVSLAWLLSRPAVASAIVGAETEAEVTANATAADVTLDQAQLDALTALPAGKDS